MTKDMFEEFCRKLISLYDTELLVFNRIDHIIRKIQSAFDIECGLWSFRDLKHESSRRALWLFEALGGSCIRSECTDIGIILPNNIEMNAIINGKKYLLNKSFPIRWLYDDEFEKELLDGKAKYIEETELQKEKEEQERNRIIEKMNEEEIISTARKAVSKMKPKLSPQEYSALNKIIGDNV